MIVPLTFNDYVIINSVAVGREFPFHSYFAEFLRIMISPKITYFIFEIVHLVKQ